MAIAPTNLPPEPPAIADMAARSQLRIKENVNYRVEHVYNGYILHVTRGKDGPITKVVFMDKAALLKHLEGVL